MKQQPVIRIFAMCILLAVCLLSCGKEKAEEEGFRNEEYFFFAIGEGAPLLRCSVDGVVSRACQDPLCSHHPDTCLLNGISGTLRISDRYVLYRRNNNRQAWIYSIETAETRMLYEVPQENPGFIQDGDVTNEYAYLYVDHYEVINDIPIQQGSDYFRCAVDGSSTELLTEDPLKQENYAVMAYTEDRLGVVDEAGNRVAATTKLELLEDEPCPTEHDSCYADGYYYFSNYRVHAETGEKEEIIPQMEGVSDQEWAFITPTIVGDYIVFQYLNHSQELWRVHRDGTNVERLLSLTELEPDAELLEPYKGMNFSDTLSVNPSLQDRYFLAGSDSTAILVDMETKEIKFIDYSEFSNKNFSDEEIVTYPASYNETQAGESTVQT